MRGLRIRVAAAALAVGLLPGAGAAAAAGEQPAGLIFAPDLAGPGDLVTVRTGACGPASSGVVYAKSLGGTVVMSPGLRPGMAEGAFRVFSTATPGAHTIRGFCADGTRLDGVLKVPESWIGRPGGA